MKREIRLMNGWINVPQKCQEKIKSWWLMDKWEYSYVRWFKVLLHWLLRTCFSHTQHTRTHIHIHPWMAVVVALESNMTNNYTKTFKNLFLITLSWLMPSYHPHTLCRNTFSKSPVACGSQPLHFTFPSHTGKAEEAEVATQVSLGAGLVS
jgi:hypothetical protein